MAAQCFIASSIIISIAFGITTSMTQGLKANSKGQEGVGPLLPSPTAGSNGSITALRNQNTSNNQSTPNPVETPVADPCSCVCTDKKSTDDHCKMRLDPISVKVLVGETNGLRVHELPADPKFELPQPVVFWKKRELLYSVDYHYKKGLMFYTALDTLIVKIQVSGAQTVGPPTVMFNDTIGSTSIAVDWLEDKIYWIHDRWNNLSNETANWSIEVANLDGSNRTTLVENVHYIFPYNIAIDPYDKWLFYVSNKTVFRYNLNRTTNVGEVNFGINVSAKCIALDRHEKKLYISARKDEVPYVARSEYNGSNFKVLDICGKYNDFFSIDVFRNWLIFTDYAKDKGKDIAYSIQLKSTSRGINSPTKCQPAVIQESDTQKNGIWSLKFYHPNVQSETDVIPCLENDEDTY